MLFATVDGIKIYDPRDDTRKVSDNPALILGHIVEKTGAVVGEGFWPGIAKLADYCDGVEPFKMIERKVQEGGMAFLKGR